MNTPEWTLQDRIRKAREHAALTQVEFAERIGVSRNTLNRWEGGIHAPSDALIEQIAKVTNIPIEWFYAPAVESTQRNATTPPERVVLEWDGNNYNVTH